MEYAIKKGANKAFLRPNTKYFYNNIGSNAKKNKT